jgi:DNA/RNA endonuclease G (NUC1)
MPSNAVKSHLKFKYLEKSALTPTYTNALNGIGKWSIVKLLYKNEDKSNVSNYKPISLPTGFYKIYVKVMYKRAMHHLNSNGISVKEQFGFRKDISTNKAT